VGGCGGASPPRPRPGGIATPAISSTTRATPLCTLLCPPGAGEMLCPGVGNLRGERTGWGGQPGPSKATLHPHAAAHEPRGRVPVSPSSPSAGHLPRGVPRSASRRRRARRRWARWAPPGSPARHRPSPLGRSWGRSQAAWGAGPPSPKRWP